MKTKSTSTSTVPPAFAPSSALTSHTHTTLRGLYTVHELVPNPLHREPSGELSLADPPAFSTPSSWEKGLHANEAQGEDIRADEDGLWRDILSREKGGGEGGGGDQANESESEINVSAASIVHRVPCLGYVFTLPIPPSPSPSVASKASSSYKVVVLGDTSDPSSIMPLAQNATVLVHEGTNFGPVGELNDYTAAQMDAQDEAREREAREGKAEEATEWARIRDADPLFIIHRIRAGEEKVRKRAITRGHSTVKMAAEFARRINADRLILTHLSARIPPDPPKNTQRNGTGLPEARQIPFTSILLGLRIVVDHAFYTGHTIFAHDFLTVPLSHDRYDVSSNVGDLEPSSRSRPLFESLEPPRSSSLTTSSSSSSSSSSPTNPDEVAELKLKKHRHSATMWQSLHEIIVSQRIEPGDKGPTGVEDLLATVEDIVTTEEDATSMPAMSDQESVKEGKGEGKRKENGEREREESGISRQMEDVRENSMDSETVPRSRDGDQERR